MRYGPLRAVIGGAILLALAALAHALTFPQLSGRVAAKSGDQVVVVTLKSLQDTSIEDYGYQLGRHWGIGQKGTNNGAILIVAPSEKKVRIDRKSTRRNSRHTDISRLP